MKTITYYRAYKSAEERAILLDKWLAAGSAVLAHEDIAIDRKPVERLRARRLRQTRRFYDRFYGVLESQEEQSA